MHVSCLFILSDFGGHKLRKISGLTPLSGARHDQSMVIENTQTCLTSALRQPAPPGSRVRSLLLMRLDIPVTRPCDRAGGRGSASWRFWNARKASHQWIAARGREACSARHRRKAVYCWQRQGSRRRSRRRRRPALLHGRVARLRNVHRPSTLQLPCSAVAARAFAIGRCSFKAAVAASGRSFGCTSVG